jgi:GT2 family glycosyltransferase
MEPSVAVVILNWNGVSYLKSFLPQLINTLYGNLQLIVGDNASTDESVSYLKANFPQIRIIQNDRNYGFAEGYNRVLSQVKADYFVLLNSDVDLPVNWISPVISVMEKDPLIAAAQPKIKSYTEPLKFEYAGAAGGFLDKFGFPFCRGRIFDVIEQDLNQYNDPIEIFWASGAALFVKRHCWEEVGGLDPDFFAHMEEIDVCWRLKNRGYKIVYCPDAEVFHVGGGTLNSSSPFKTYLNFRNNLYLLQKNLNSRELYLMLFIRICIDFVAWLHFLASGEGKFAWAINKAHFNFFQNYSKTSKKRIGPAKPFLTHTGVYHSSIVWSFFIKKIRCFKDLQILTRPLMKEVVAETK